MVVGNDREDGCGEDGIGRSSDLCANTKRRAEGGAERETHPGDDPGSRGIFGKSRGFCLWKWGEFPVMDIGVASSYRGPARRPGPSGKLAAPARASPTPPRG